MKNIEFKNILSNLNLFTDAEKQLIKDTELKTGLNLRGIEPEENKKRFYNFILIKINDIFKDEIKKRSNNNIITDLSDLRERYIISNDLLDYYNYLNKNTSLYLINDNIDKINQKHDLNIILCELFDVTENELTDYVLNKLYEKEQRDLEDNREIKGKKLTSKQNDKV